MFRSVAAVRAPIARAIARPAVVSRVAAGSFILFVCTKANLCPVRFNSGGAHAHETESFESFNARYQTFFSSVTDLFELQRGLNNCFAYDLVPTVDVVEAALRASRKVNDYATAVRVLEGVREKVENKGQYQQYLDELKPVIEELGESIQTPCTC